MREGPRQPDLILALAAVLALGIAFAALPQGRALLALGIAFAALPQGRALLKQWLFRAGLIYADPMTGLQ